MSLNWSATGIIIAEFAWLRLTLFLHFISSISNFLGVDEPCIADKPRLFAGLTDIGQADILKTGIK